MSQTDHILDDVGPPQGILRRGGSRILILVLILAASAIAIAPVIIGRGHRVRVMREELQAVLSQCRAKYGVAGNAADSAKADEWVPHDSTGIRAGDPPCGSYRRRNMLSPAA
jgi:hypothetical protein